MLTIAVDAMGGDHAPKCEVEGAIRAAEELQIGVILVGQEDVVRAELALHPQAAGLPIEVHHASEFITMEDSAAKAVRSRRTPPFASPAAWCGTASPRASSPRATPAR